MARRIGIWALVLALLLGGCASDLAPEKVPGEGSVAGEEGGEGSPVYYLAISNRARDEVIDGAALFCEKLTELSGGRIQLRLAYSENPAESLRNGSAQFAVLSSREDYQGSSLLEAGATPFLYSSYLNFSMKTNASATLKFLATALEPLGMRPLGAYYQGATHMLGDFGTENYQQYQSMVIAVNPLNSSEAAFGVVDAGTVAVESAVQRAQMLLEGQVNAAEFRLEELALVEFESMPGLCLTLTYHGITPVWLMVDSRIYDSLDAAGQALLVEACAYLTNAIDDVFTGLEAEWVYRMLDEDVEVFYELIGTRNRIRNNKYGKIWEITDPENAQAVEQFLALLDSLA